MGGVKLMVLSQEGSWRIGLGEKLSRPYGSQKEAVRAAFDNAKTLAKDGIECEVVMSVMTCQFGPNNFFKAVPTPLNALNNDG